MKKDPSIKYWKHALVPLPKEEIAEQRRRMIRDAEAAVIKAERAVEKAEKALREAIDRKMYAYTNPVVESEYKYIECKEKEADWMVDQTGCPLKFRNTFGKWTSCDLSATQEPAPGQDTPSKG